MTVMIKIFVAGWIITMIENDSKGFVEELRPAVTVDLEAEATATVATAVDRGHRVAAIVAHLVEAGVIVPMCLPGRCQRVQADPGVTVVAEAIVKGMTRGVRQVLLNLQGIRSKSRRTSSPKNREPYLCHSL
jgi:hypothetical protein